MSKRLNPFGRGTFIAIGLAVVSFALIPLAVRAGFGRGGVASVSAVAAGCLVQAVGLWRFRDSLRLKALPGASRLTSCSHPRGWPDVAKILPFLIWLPGLAVIFGVAVLLARRARSRPAGPQARAAVAGLPRGSRCRDGSPRSGGPSARPLVFLGVIVVGSAVVFGVMALLGQLVLHAGPSIDKPINNWVSRAPDPPWKG